jgi:hypothetical protein
MEIECRRYVRSEIISVGNIFVAKRLVFVFLSLAMLSGGIAAQKTESEAIERRALIGTWEILERESSFGQRNREHFKNYIIDILIVGDEVTVRKRYDQGNQRIDKQYLMFADGSGEVNGDVQSKTKWDKNRLARKFNYKTNFGWIDVSEEYRLSQGSEKLIFESRSKSDGNMSVFEDNYRLVFIRKAP